MSRPKPSQDEPVLRWLGLFYLFSLIAVSGILHGVGRDRAFQVLNGLPPVCPLRIVLGMRCSFCGMTHAFFHAIFGEWRSAISENLLSLPLFFGLWILALLALLGRLPTLSHEQGRKGVWTALGILIVYALLRNTVLENAL